MADFFINYRKDDVLIGDDGTKVATADSDYPEWAYRDQIFWATLEDVHRSAAISN